MARAVERKKAELVLGLFSSDAMGRHTRISAFACNPTLGDKRPFAGWLTSRL